MTSPDYDVVILGGGLAGGSLARQLRLEAPSLRVLIVEKRQHPVREAAFKVGESSVEIGAHYFQKILGLEPHLRSHQLEKLGLRYFFTRVDNRDLAARFELGPAVFPQACPQLQEYVRKHAPKAELLLHQTWAYRCDDPRFAPKTPKVEPSTREIGRASCRERVCGVV